jgi:hypothetical protein
MHTTSRASMRAASCASTALLCTTAAVNNTRADKVGRAQPRELQHE